MRETSDGLQVRTPAKVNLTLEVLGQRPDGYHEIRSVLVPVSLFDVLDMALTPATITTEVVADGVALNGLADLDPERNLVTRAAEALRAETGERRGLRVRLRKRIPVGGGLGGGSADAAAVLIGANRLWDANVPAERLQMIGVELGCDVPALVHGGPVRMAGAGETVSGLAAGGDFLDPGWWLVIVNPCTSISTRDIYQGCTPVLTSEQGAFNSMVSSLANGDVVKAADSLCNGLQDTVVTKYPLIGILLEELERAGALGALLSGSGASVFGLARDRAHAEAVATRVVAGAGLPVWCEVVRMLPDGVMVAHQVLDL